MRCLCLQAEKDSGGWEMSLRLVYMADVFCPWCYGFGPIVKRLVEENPQIPLTIVGGNLVSRPMTLAEDYAADPGLVDFWREVERVTARPLTGAIEAALSGREVRMYSPGADEILVALHEFAPGAELEQLLYLEDLFYLKGEDMFSEASLAKTAAHWQIPVGKFERALDSDAAMEATRQNLEAVERLIGESGTYPCLFVEKDGRVHAVTRGFVHYETVASRLGDVMRSLDIEPVPHLGCSVAGHCSAGKGRPR